MSSGSKGLGFGSTRPAPLSFRAIKDLAFHTVTVGRKFRGRNLAVGHFASWHPKMTIIKPRKTSRAPLTIHAHAGAAPTHGAKTTCGSTELIRPPIFCTRHRQTVRGFLREKKTKKRDCFPYGRIRARARIPQNLQFRSSRHLACVHTPP